MIGHFWSTIFKNTTIKLQKLDQLVIIPYLFEKFFEFFDIYVVGQDIYVVGQDDKPKRLIWSR